MNARLALERDAVQRILPRTERAFLRRIAADARAYEIVFEVRTLVCDDRGVIREEARSVPVLYDLAADHPRRNPVVIAAHADLFNTHIHDPRDGCNLPPLPFICLGGFSASMTIADWIVATFYVLAWERIAADHPMNCEAAAWARLEMGRGRFPIDRGEFFAHQSAEPARSAEASNVPRRAALRLGRGGGHVG